MGAAYETCEVKTSSAVSSDGSQLETNPSGIVSPPPYLAATSPNPFESFCNTPVTYERRMSENTPVARLHEDVGNMRPCQAKSNEEDEGDEAEDILTETSM
ncbi:hypothetical protein DXG01_000624, partial [Tephrocybe rancida]